MWDRGIVIADGSDAPCTRPDPIRGMHLAVNHPNPAQRLTPYEALLMRTRNAAWLGFDERSAARSRPASARTLPCWTRTRSPSRPRASAISE